ncbi:hypothetical protein HOY82DRAFT_607373 [Tuber indicum]|nr:hypothetical protein HOY82DRAFT_607373 [Tuber indicum]
MANLAAVVALLSLSAVTTQVTWGKVSSIQRHTRDSINLETKNETKALDSTVSTARVASLLSCATTRGATITRAAGSTLTGDMSYLATLVAFGTTAAAVATTTEGTNLLGGIVAITRQMT